MTRRAQILGLATALVLLSIVIALIFAYVRLNEYQAPTTKTPIATTNIPVTHSWKDGVHTFAGSLRTPSPCYTISGDALVRESYPESVSLLLATNPSSSVCAQVITEKRFSVSFKASEGAVIVASLNGIPVNLSITEATSTAPTLKS